jgi:heme/copper-type cytochrome/quinol oxidase subunit 2
MWGDLLLLELYPRNWQASFFRTTHPWLLQVTLWHYWFWYTFIIALNLYFIFIFRALTYRRADVRGTRATGDKRRLAWPEMLVILLPFYWSISVIINAFAYLRLIDGNNSFPVISVQIAGYQWGWKYCYGDTFYPRYFSYPVHVGRGTRFIPGGSLFHVHRDELWMANNAPKEYKINAWGREVIDWKKTLELRKTHSFNKRNEGEIMTEMYFSRYWLKYCGALESALRKPVKHFLFHSGYWVSGQGIDPNVTMWKRGTDESLEMVKDPLRLLRSTGAIVLPTRSNIRLMSTSEDVTHSWAMPGIGLKMDCVPGRLFCAFTILSREGIYFGQCSELCGWNHYNMPAILYALPIEHFIVWWELELHSIFLDDVYNFSNSILNGSGEVDKLNYSLLNSKYK